MTDAKPSALTEGSCLAAGTALWGGRRPGAGIVGRTFFLRRCSVRNAIRSRVDDPWAPVAALRQIDRQARRQDVLQPDFRLGGRERTRRRVRSRPGFQRQLRFRRTWAASYLQTSTPAAGSPLAPIADPWKVRRRSGALSIGCLRYVGQEGLPMWQSRLATFAAVAALAIGSATTLTQLSANSETLSGGVASAARSCPKPASSARVASHARVASRARVASGARAASATRGSSASRSAQAAHGACVSGVASSRARSSGVRP